MKAKNERYVVPIIFEDRKQAEKFRRAYNDEPVGWAGYSTAEKVENYTPIFSIFYWLSEVIYNINRKLHRR